MPDTAEQSPAPEHGSAGGTDEKKETLALSAQALLARIQDRHQKGFSANEENRRLHTEDLRFVYDSETSGQWDPTVLSLRTGRPSYTFNRVLQPINLVLGDQRQSRPAVKVRPASSGSSGAVAEVMGGLWRAIWQDSHGDDIADEQFKQAVGGGYGELRLLPVWPNERTFDQVLRVINIPNPQTVIRDPETTDPCGADSNWVMIGDRISKEKHRTLYPGKDEFSFSMSRDSYGWFTQDEIRVVEYMERVPVKIQIAQLDDGRIVDWTDEEKAVEAHLKTAREDGNYPKVTNKREFTSWKVMWVKVNGAAVLEGPITYNWRRIPVIRIPGRYVNIEGRIKLQSLVRHAKDPQRSYNSRRSDMIERSALIPKAPYLVTKKMILGYEDVWSNANTVPRPYLPYNVDDASPDKKPVRERPIDLPDAALALAQQDAQDIQAATGYFDPALGNADDMNRVSGKALVTHTRRSDLGSHEFIDNYGKAMQLLAECAIDMIPTIYDAERIVRTLGADGVEKLVKINGQTGSNDIVHDLSAGSYDCTVTLGPSYQTARQEQLATLIDAAETLPLIGQVAPDLIAKQIDLPDTEELVRRLRIGLIHAGIVKPTPLEQQNMPPPPPPDPLKQAELERAQALAARDKMGAAKATAEVMASPLHAQGLHEKVVGDRLANLKTAHELSGENPALTVAAVARGVLNAQQPPGQPGAPPPGAPQPVPPGQQAPI